tara:strand:- start:127 stop:507 length:381 start_codon:yes stop_codon:yes gene_type:complete
MTFEKDWVFMTQSKLRTPLRIWFGKRRITTYEQAKKALREAGLSVGTREEVAKHLPSPPDKDVVTSNPSPPTVSSNARSTKKVQRKNSSKAPKSEAEKAADAITESTPVKSPKEAPTRRKRKSKKS